MLEDWQEPKGPNGHALFLPRRDCTHGYHVVYHSGAAIGNSYVRTKADALSAYIYLMHSFMLLVVLEAHLDRRGSP